MNDDNPDRRILERTVGDGTPDASLVLLHGLGADAMDLAGVADHLPLPEGRCLRIVLPDAPVRPVTVNGGMAMRAWYDIDPAGGLDSGREDIEASVAELCTLVQRERDAGNERIFVGGFSQGGVIALETLLTTELPLAGAVALSTYLHDAEHAEARVAFTNAGAPVFLAHGLGDPMIPIQRAAQSRTKLEALGYDVSWQEYPMGHEVCLPELEALAGWLGAR